MTDQEQAIAEIELYGFVVLHDVLHGDRVAAMREALIRCEDEYGTQSTHRGNARHVSTLPVLDKVFHETIAHPRILPLLENFLGETLVLGSLNARIVCPGDGDQPLHSDIPQGMLNMASPVMMNTVWLLDDFSARNGGTRVVPGSHKSGLGEPPAGFDVKHIVQPAAAAGSVIMFNGQCWHAGGANNSDTRRHAMFGHYRNHMLLFQLDPHDDFEPTWFEGLSDRQKQLLRMTRGVGSPHAADAHFR